LGSFGLGKLASLTVSFGLGKLASLTISFGLGKLASLLSFQSCKAGIIITVTLDLLADLGALGGGRTIGRRQNLKLVIVS